MLSQQLKNTFIDIVIETVRMVASHVDKSDLAKGINYASIYAQSPEEFDKISHELMNNGKVVLKRSSGDYYQLEEPLSTPVTKISYCRVRMFDNEHPERGYVDFEVKNYQSFKDKYLARPYFSLINSGEEMIKLKDPKFKVRAYFPSGPF